MSLTFEVTAGSGAARAGTLRTAHGSIETPAFLPVATQASVKGLTPRDLRTIGVQGVLANTYHLWLQPGEELVQAAGGLHAFMGWDGPIVTDSGGFQVMSLAGLARVEEQGVTFRSHRDGGERLLAPETAIQVQAALGADVAMVLDICPPYPCEPAAVVEATERTVRWAERCLAAAETPLVEPPVLPVGFAQGRLSAQDERIQGTGLFAIVQGGTDLALRRWCAAELRSLPFDGYAIGGLSVGEDRRETWPALDATLEELPEGAPRYLMGVGAPADLVEAIARGVDLFDSVLPTRLGRHGTVLTREGRVDLKGSKRAERTGPLDPECDCPACTQFGVGFLRHLLRIGDDLGLRLASLHNVRYLTRLVGDARQAILEGRFPGGLR